LADRAMATLDELQAWVDRLFTAGSVAELLDG
jgi:hypothetical protein